MQLDRNSPAFGNRGRRAQAFGSFALTSVQSVVSLGFSQPESTSSPPVANIVALAQKLLQRPFASSIFPCPFLACGVGLVGLSWSNFTFFVGRIYKASFFIQRAWHLHCFACYQVSIQFCQTSRPNVFFFAPACSHSRLRLESYAKFSRKFLPKPQRCILQHLRLRRGWPHLLMQRHGWNKS